MALRGVKVIEMAGLAPVPFCGMILSDFGAQVNKFITVSNSSCGKVLRVDRPHSVHVDVCSRGKRSIAVDLKKPEGISIVKRLCSSADVLVEPFRAGVMEKLGLGPKTLLEENPRLIYARLTGFGQSGPLAARAGHDINYLAISGVLSKLGRNNQKPHFPVNLLADFAGGGMTCAMGIIMALFERSRSGKGQVVDCNMVEGAAYMSSFLWLSQHMANLPLWGRPRGENMLDGGAHFYDTYETSDGEYMSVGAIEPQFYAELLKGLGLSAEEAPQFGPESGELKQKFTDIFKSKTQAEWCEIFDNADACVMPILHLNKVHNHPHSMYHNSFLPTPSGHKVPKPAPNLDRTPACSTVAPDPKVGEHTVEILKEHGFKSKEMKSLLENGVVVQNDEAKSKL